MYLSSNQAVILNTKMEHLTVTKYWSAIDKSTHQPYQINRYENALEIVEQVLQRAVKMQMVADVNVGCFLSGGIDSSLIAALAQKNSAVPIKTYAMAFKEKGFDESGYAREIARHLKTDHHTLTFSPG